MLYGRSGLSETSRSVFGSTGWLFADLMLAIAMAFLVANTVGVHTPHRPVTKKLVCSQPALDRFHPVKVPLVINPTGLTSRSRTADASVRQQVERVHGLKKRRAGFVIIYTGNAETSSYALVVDGFVKKVLMTLPNQKLGFRSAAYLDEQIIGAEPNSSQLEVYLFEPQQCTTITEPPT